MNGGKKSVNKRLTFECWHSLEVKEEKVQKRVGKRKKKKKKVK
jgi:hypothetical protein